MTRASKIGYLLKSISRFFSEKKCPYCNHKKLAKIDRKYVFTSLLKCNNCALMFRHPSDSTSSNFKFYNGKYQQNGITTDLPSDKELRSYLVNEFTSTNRSIAVIKNILENLIGDLSNKTLLDYGCSWGYSAWQFKQVGMRVTGFEIDRARAKFGVEKLDLRIATNQRDIHPKLYDVIFSSHVIEHLPDLKFFKEFCLKSLAENGILILLSPNGSEDFKLKSPKNFHLSWGQVHPNLISAEFYSHIFKSYPMLITSTPFNLERIRNWDQKQTTIDLNGGGELLCIVKRI